MLEAAASGVLAQPIELKTSRAGKPYAQLALALDGGTDEEGRKLTTWLRATVFGETAELLARTATKGCKIYAEGALSLNSWADKATGETKSGLSMACWKAEKIGTSAIGKNRPKRKIEKGHTAAAETFRQPGQAERQLRATAFAIDGPSDPMPF